MNAAEYSTVEKALLLSTTKVCIKYHEFCIKNDEFEIKHDDC